MIDDCIEDESFAESRRQVREEAWAFQGEGAVRMADYLVKKYEELKKAQEEPKTEDTEKSETKEPKGKKVKA